MNSSTSSNQHIRPVSHRIEDIRGGGDGCKLGAGAGADAVLRPKHQKADLTMQALDIT